MPARTRTAPAADAAASFPHFCVTSCQRYDVGRYAAWRQIAADQLDVVFFVGDYIYEYASKADAVRRHEGTVTHTLDDYRARYATYKSDPQLQAAHCIGAVAAGGGTTTRCRTTTPTCAPEIPEPDFAARRAAAYRAYWEHMPFPKSLRPTGPDMRIVGRLDWGTLARIHLVDDRQYRDVQACTRPGRGGSTTLPLADCPGIADPKRTLLGFEQERWLADGWDGSRPWNLLAQQTLMARFSWTDPHDAGRGTYWTDGWDGYVPARNRLLGAVAAKQVPGVIVLGGDVHSHYVADLKPDYDDPASPVVASEFCGKLHHQPVAAAIARRCGTRVQPAHPLWPFRPARAT